MNVEEPDGHPFTANGPKSLTPEVLFIDDLARMLRTSRSTIERRRRAKSFPIPELPAFDGRPRWGRSAVENFLAATDNGNRSSSRRTGGRR
jgi:hypothetical protein